MSITDNSITDNSITDNLWNDLVCKSISSYANCMLESEKQGNCLMQCIHPCALAGCLVTTGGCLALGIISTPFTLTADAIIDRYKPKPKPTQEIMI